MAETAVGGDILVLLAHRLPDDFYFDATGFLCQVFRRFKDAAVGVKSVQQAHRKAARRAEPGPGRNIGDGDYLDAAGNPHQLQALPGDGMAQLIDAVHYLGAGIADPDRIVEALVDHDVHVLVDRRAHHRPRLESVEIGQVGAPAGEAEPERSAGDNHLAPPVRKVSKAFFCSGVPISWNFRSVT